MEKRVLLVDDEKDILIMLEEIFRSGGYSPRCSTNGEEALEIMKRDNIRVIFTDLRMPIMDGLELCRQIKQLEPTACVYALSAFAAAYSSDQFREAGFDGRFSKPFKIEEVIDACREAFERLDQQDKQENNES